MYGREIDGKLHTFGVSGKLIMNALVMYDHQTDSLWSQFLGQAVKGPLEGTRLDFIPVTQTLWSQWIELHPDTLVLDKGEGYRSDPYDSYYASGSPGIIGEALTDSRLQRKEYVVGVAVREKAKAYPFRLLSQRPVINDSFEGQELLVFFDPSTDTALVYDRTLDGQTLTFRLSQGSPGTQAILADEETGSKWLAFIGQATEGPLKGKTLQRVTSHYSFWFAWNDWHPDTELYEG